MTFCKDIYNLNVLSSNFKINGNQKRDRELERDRGREVSLMACETDQPYLTKKKSERHFTHPPNFAF